MFPAFIRSYGAGAYDAAVEHAALMFPEQRVKTVAAREQARIHHFTCEQGNDADPGKNIDAMHAAFRINNNILEESISLVPDGYARAGVAGKRICDCQKLAVGLDSNAFIGGIFNRDFKRDHGELQGKHRHPAGRIGLLQRIAWRQRLGAVVHRDIVKPEKPPLKYVHASGILAVDPPGMVQQQLVQHAL